jgi:mono/diheme cytochrome c family protein
MSIQHMPTPLPVPPTTRHRKGRFTRNMLIGTFVGLLVVFGAMQLVPYGRTHTNPVVQAEPAWNASETRALFFRGCADCHSNQTSWPWYSTIAPVSWLITRDVEDGRAEFNVSEWGRPENSGEDAVESVQNGSMPPWYYTMLHPSAQLSQAEQQQLITGMLATFGGEGGESGEGADD